MTATGPQAATKSFSDLGLADDLADALTDAGITNPFPIQELTLPLALSGADIIGQARTGTGKTLAFGLPMLQRLDPARSDTQVLVVVPTRELCLQVRDDLDRAGARSAVRVVAAYGGRSIEPQADAIAAGAPIVVGTPGRLLDLMRRRQLDLSTVTGLVLDEADEMLDLGFLPDVEQLIEATAQLRQTLLFSATMPSAVVALARRYMRKPTYLRADVEEVRIAPETAQYFFSCHRLDKPAVLARILQTPERGLCLVFTRTKRMADMLAADLRERQVDATPIHSDLRQDARERALTRFRQGKIDVLVATEVAARGLDIDEVTHVVNYDCPDDEKMYLHRIGRTGRAGAAGVAITLAVWNELARLEMIKRALEIDAETHEVFSTSPILEELFELPPLERRRASAGRRESSDEDGGSGGSGGGRKPERAPDATPTEPGGPRRRRTRTRRKPHDEPKPEAKPEQQQEPVPAPDESPRRRRRSRRGADAPDERDQREGTRTRTRRVSGKKQDVSPQPTSQQPRTTARPAAGAGDQRQDGGRARDDGGRKRTAERRAESGRRQSAGRSGDRRPTGRDRARRGPRPAAAVVDTAAARGSGKPRLRRPLEIEHLP